MRVYVGSLATETNTFAPFPTGRAAFEEYGIERPSLTSEEPLAKAFSAKAAAFGDEIVSGTAAFAQPANRTVKSVYEELRDTILGEIANEGPFDLILLLLHGAMVAEGYDDCEGDILERVHKIAPNATVGVELDPHCHLTTRIIELSDVTILYKEYPHIDMVERAMEIYDITRRTRLGEIKPVAALIDTRLVGIYPTFFGPMAEIVAELRAAETRPGVLSASIAHGFPWADVGDVGTRVLVYTDNDPELAASEAMAITERLYAQRFALRPDYPDIASSLDRAGGLNGRIVLGDHADNAGGGAPSDSTFFLEELVRRDVDRAVIGSFHDPAVVRIALDAGVGAVIDVRLGGKSGPASGNPIDLRVTVKGVSENHVQTMAGMSVKMGAAAWLQYRGIDIVVNTIRGQVYAPSAFTGLGLDLDDKRVIVVKSSSHFEAAFTPIADHLWRVDSPGAMTLDFAGMPYTKRDGDYFPRIEDPWAVRGKPVPSIIHPSARR